jgi:glycine/D-amino acid oxidase-like deaminating enzyme
VSTAREHGVESRILSSREVSNLAPGSSFYWRSGLYAPGDAQAEPARATAAFAAAAKARGVLLNEGTPVMAIDITNGAATGVITPKGCFSASTIVCASGIGTHDIARSIGVTLPILAVRAPVARTNAGPSSARTAFWTPHVAFRPKRDGSFVLGNGYREIDAELDLTVDAFRHFFAFLPAFLANFSVVQISVGKTFFADLGRKRSALMQAQPWPEPAVNARLLRVIEREFYKVYPQYKAIGLSKIWAGRIDATPDLIPIIGRIGPKNFIVAAGFNGHGFTLSPAIGRLLSEVVVDMHPSLDLSCFGLNRFANGKAQVRSGPL